MKKGILAFFTAIAIVLTGLFCFLYVTEDRQGPEIHADAVVTYTEGADRESLLAGVTAVDDRDGDVTDSLRVEKILTDEASGHATVIYTAKDERNNISKLSVQVPLIDGTESKDTIVPVSTSESDDPEQIVTPTPTPDVPEVLDGEAENEEKIAELPAGAPHFYLTEYEVTIKVGENINRLSYVKEIEDDEDERNSLFQKIQIDGNVNHNTPGTYELEYFVIDSDQNMSNRAVLKVIVE